MSLQIDDLDQIDGKSTQTSNDDIFSNPLEAFPEFIDEPMRTAEESPVQEEHEEKPAETPAATQEPIIKEEKPASQTIPRFSSPSYTDPLSTIEEVDAASLSSSVQDFSFGDDDIPAVDTGDMPSFLAKTNFTSGIAEYEDVAVRKSDALFDIDDSVPDEAPVTEEVSVDDFLSDAGSATEEIDLDAFLGDSDFSAPSPAPSASTETEEISLDDFGVDFGGIDVSAIDSFAASAKQEKSDIENTPAIEMELEFDDEFVLETKANPEDDIDFDFEALMSGESIAVPTQATGDETLDNFDDIFANIVDESAPAAPSASSSEVEFDPSAIEEVSFDSIGLGSSSSETSAETISEQKITYDEVSEFDDLLSSFSDDTHVEVAENQRNVSNKTGPHDYNIIVVMEDEDDTPSIAAEKPRVEETDDEEEDYVVSIFKTAEEADTFRRHDGGPAPEGFTSDDAVFSSDPGVLSDSFEDISLDDFGVSFEDETPAAHPEEPTASAETAPESQVPSDIPEDEPDFMAEETAEVPSGFDIPEDEPDYSAVEMDEGTEPSTDVSADIPEDEPTFTEQEEIAPEQAGFDEDILLDMPDEEALAALSDTKEEAETSVLPDLPDMPDDFVMPDIPDDESDFDFSDIPDMSESTEEPSENAEDENQVSDMPEFTVQQPAEQEISYEEQYGEIPTVENILKEAEASAPDSSEQENTMPEYEDTASDDKIIVEKSEICVYNGDNTEDTSNMTDGNNEEITDTMNSTNEGLLEKIVSELSVLRNEMQSLKDEVQSLKGGSDASFEAPAFEETPAEPAFSETTEEPAFEETAPQEDEFTLPEDSAPAEDASGEVPPEEETVMPDIPLPDADQSDASQEGGFFSGDDEDETIALSGDELNNILNSANFTQEDGSNFGMEAPEGSVLPDGLTDSFGTESEVSEEAPAEEPAVEDSAFEETPAESEETAPASDDFDINFDETPASEEAPAEEPAFPEASESEPSAVIGADDFNTDLPSLKEDAVAETSEEAPAEEEAAATGDNFSLDDFDIPEPSVDESSINDFDIDEQETEPKAEEEFSLDEFNIPEPSVEESSISDIEIDEPSAEIPSDEPVPEDTDFYANSDAPSITEDDMPSIDINQNLEEPVLDDIDFSLDEPAQEDIEIPTGDNLIVDSSSTDFLEEDDPTLDEQLTSDKVDYLNEDASVDGFDGLSESAETEFTEEEAPAVEGMEDSLESDILGTSEDETPADDVFSSQWDAPADSASFDENPEEGEFVHAATSFDDPIGFDIEDVPSEPAESEVPAKEPSFDEPAADFTAPEASSEEPAFEETAPASEPASDGELSGDIKQEVKSVLKYMDQLLENLPEDKIAEFAQSEHFETYKKLFNELGLV